MDLQGEHCSMHDVQPGALTNAPVRTKHALPGCLRWHTCIWWIKGGTIKQKFPGKEGQRSMCVRSYVQT